MAQDPKTARLVRVLTDGRPANLTQALGLAEALARIVAVEIETAEVRLEGWRARLPGPLAAAALPRGAWSALRPRPDLAIGAGRRGNLAARLLARAGVPAVAVLDPGRPLGDFAAVVLPEHDRRRGGNVLTTLGAMSRLTPQAIAAAPCPVPRLPAPRLAVLIGGPSRSAGFDAGALLADLDRFRGWSVIATASRRTPAGLVARLRAARPGDFIWDGTGPNPYPGMLGLADAVLVTADSISMASEAATSGRPVFVSGRPSPGKNARFHAALAARGIARPAEAAPALWRYPPLAEADRIAALLARRLGFLPGDAAPIQEASKRRPP